MKIVGFGQLYVIETGQMVGQIVVEHGQTQISLTISDEDLQQLTQLLSESSGPATSGFSQEVQPEFPPPRYEVSEPQFMGTFPRQDISVGPEIGEMVDRESPQFAEVPTNPRPVRPIVDSEGWARPPMARTIQKDEMGYPIVSNTTNSKMTRQAPGDDGVQF